MAVLLGLFGALAFGLADFLGGLASKRIAPIMVAWWNQAISIPIVALMAFVYPVHVLTRADVVLSVVGGVAIVLALQLLYATLRTGAMGVLTAITGICSALVPAAWAFGQGERLGPVEFLGVGFSALAIVLVVMRPGEGVHLLTHRRQVAMAAASGLLFGVGWALIARVNDEAGVGSLLIMRGVGLCLAAALVTRAAAWKFREGQSTLQAVLAGVGAIAATFAFVVAARIDAVAIVSVLQAMAPLVTTVLAFFVLRQRLTQLQNIALACAIGGALCLALG